MTKEKDEIIERAKKNKLSGLRRNHDYFNSMFIAFMVATVIFGLNLMKTIIEHFSQGNIGIAFGIFIVFFLGLITIAAKNSETAAFLSLKIKEQKLDNSKKRAYDYIDELTLKK